MADISKIELPSGTTYDIKDQGARDLIAEIESYTAYLGVTTTALTDGATTNPITINSESVTAKNGNIVNYGSKEFIFNGTAWQEFGDLSALGSLAYKNSASGSVSVTTTGAVTTVSHGLDSATASGTDTVLKDVTNSAPTFTGTQKYLHLSAPKQRVTSTGNFTPSGSVTIGTGTGTANYTPSGTVSQPTFTGTAGNISLLANESCADVAIGIGASSDDAINDAESNLANNVKYISFTPSGHVSSPTITVTPSTTTIKNPTSVTVAKTVATALPTGTAPSNQITWCSVSDETLLLHKIGYTTGASISTSNVTVATGISSAISSIPTFTGTAKYIAIEKEAGTSSVTGTFTPSGTVSKPTFTGTGANLTGTFTGAEGSVSVTTQSAVTDVSISVNTTSTDGISIKPEGTVSAPTLTKTYVKPTVSATKGTTTSTGTVTVS